MSDLVFSCKDGQFWYRDWCWGDDDFARSRMATMLALFENGEHPDKQLAAECRQALADYDAFWLEHIDA